MRRIDGVQQGAASTRRHRRGPTGPETRKKSSHGFTDAANKRVLLDELVGVVPEALVVAETQQRPELRHVVL